jgi:hypothetical protein
LNKNDKKLLKIYNQLTESAQSSLMDYADFLLDKYPNIQEVQKEPNFIPRPEAESVIAAIKRLSATYPMLTETSLFNETSTLMSQHIMQGREASVVIDEIEAIFSTQYNAYKENS